MMRNPSHRASLRELRFTTSIIDDKVLHFDHCEDQDNDQLACVEPFEAEEKGTLVVSCPPR